MILFSGGRASSAARARLSRFEHDMGATNLFSCHGSVNGTKGWLRGAGSYFTWRPEDSRTRVKGGHFVATTRAAALNGSSKGRYYHLLWAGENNLTAAGGDIVNAGQMVPHLGGPGRVIVLRQRITQKDNSSQMSGCRRVKDHQRAKYGAHFLDVQSLLTTQNGPCCPTVEGLKLWNSSVAQRAIRAGRVPKVLVGKFYGSIERFTRRGSGTRA